MNKKVTELKFHSVRKLFIGLASAAFKAWKPTVNKAMAIESKPAAANRIGDLECYSGEKIEECF